MSQPARASVLLLAVFALLLALPTSAFAGDPATGKIDFAVSVEPADLAPGGSGTLVIEATLLKDQTFKGTKIEGHHIYAAGEQAISYEAIAATGVTYDMEALEISDPIEKTDEFGDTAQVWKKHFTVKVPVTLSADAAADTKLGLSFTYSGCTLGNAAMCYPPVKGHAAALVLGAPKGKAPAPRDLQPIVQVPPPSAKGEGEVTAVLDEKKGEIVVTFTPSLGYHMYGPAHDRDGTIIAEVNPLEQEGVSWGAIQQDETIEKIEEAFEVRVPFQRSETVSSITLLVTWQACSTFDGTCEQPHKDQSLVVTWPGVEGAAGAPVPAPAPTEAPKGDVLFPVIADDDLGAGESEESEIRRRMNENPILAFGLIFLLGLGLAFTPCVLPIIPITVSVISGGKADIPRNRLAGLLGVYVLGLCLTFATMGVVAAQTGGAMSALFAMPAVQWGIALLFLVLSFGMFGVYELQPPAWLMNLQGGAQRRSGSMIGAFLFGCLGAIIASPCTGPAIAALLILAANEGSAALGFAMFFVLGLGMGAVVFAVGSLNFAMRPGPWMTWVRYTFGILLVGVSMYYLRNYNLINETVMWIVGMLTCVAAAVGIAWHLNTKEGEDLGPARVKGIKVGVLSALMVVFVAWYTRPPSDMLSWTYVKDPAHLQKLVAESQEAGKPVVVDFWGNWCTNCKVYDKRIATTPSLRERFEKITRLKVDLSDETVRWPMRHALGVEESGAPVMVFLDRKGRIRRNADVVGLKDAEELATHIDVVLNDKPVKTSSAK
jgi:thiol:disulfide interchange protein DsbD